MCQLQLLSKLHMYWHMLSNNMCVFMCVRTGI